MRDIVERLRSDKWQPSVDLELLCVEAADEIERLRAALQHAARRFELMACNNDAMRNGVKPSVGAKEARDALEGVKS